MTDDATVTTAAGATPRPEPADTHPVPAPTADHAVEWAERLSLLPWDPALAVRVTLEHAGEETRRVRIERETT